MIPSGIMPAMMLHGITLERDSRLSLRRQLVGHLESRILGGQIGPGRKLPSLRRAEEFLGLHRNTVASAYRDLVQSGLVHTRPGSGVYVRPRAIEAGGEVPKVVIRGPTRADVACRDLQLALVLRKELQRRLSIKLNLSVRRNEPGMCLRLGPSVGFVRWVRSLDEPSTVALISASEFVHRLASIAVLIHGGERVGYLPVSPANRRAIDRMRRLTKHVAADHAQLAHAHLVHGLHVRAMPIISGLSITRLTTALRRWEHSRSSSQAASRTAERSLQAGVKEP